MFPFYFSLCSHVKISGLWQLVYNTGGGFGKHRCKALHSLTVVPPLRARVCACSAFLPFRR